MAMKNGTWQNIKRISKPVLNKVYVFTNRSNLNNGLMKNAYVFRSKEAG